MGLTGAIANSCSINLEIGHLGNFAMVLVQIGICDTKWWKLFGEMEWEPLSDLRRCWGNIEKWSNHKKKPEKERTQQLCFGADHTWTHTVAGVKLQSMDQNKSNKSFTAQLYRVWLENLMAYLWTNADIWMFMSANPTLTKQLFGWIGQIYV